MVSTIQIMNNFICKFSDQLSWGKSDPLMSYLNESFYCVSTHILVHKITRTVWVFEYYLEITNRLNIEYKVLGF